MKVESFVWHGFRATPKLVYAIAHELGHGAFGLKHSTDMEYDMRFDKINLMGYNNNAHLAKFQWDIIHQHSGETAFDSTDQVMVRLIIIDEKHTKLFNQVYTNNLNPYNAGAGSYQSEDWPAAWTYSDDKPEELVDKVIKKIREAESGQTVPKITLRDNGIYIGKHTVGNEEYATAIYSRKAIIGGIKKVTVSNVKDLEKYAVIKQPLYCETAFANYVVIAFYEDGEDDPSLIIQAAKKGTIDVFLNIHLEAWMKYVGVMESPANNGDFEIQLFEGNKRSGRDSIMSITAEPAMPDIRAKIVSNNKGTYKVKLEIKYLRQCTGNGAGRSPNQITSFPASGWHEIKEGEEWDINFDTDTETNRPMIRGGIAYLIAESPSGIKDTLRFFIKGTNPTVQQVNAFLSQAPYNGIWFLKKIIFHESNSPNNLTELARQFNPYSAGNENLSETTWDAFSRMPNFGSPCGWGLGQMDNPAPPPQALWDWQANVRAAYDLLMGEKHEVVIRHLNDCNIIVNGWDDPGRPIVTQPDRTEGGITYTHASSPDFTHPINTHFSNQPANNNRSFIDACWIKLYNGRGNYNYYWLAPGAIDKKKVPEWNICDYATYDGVNNYYVRDVSARNVP